MGTPVFNELEGHTTYRNDNGDVVPSVTTIIKIINKPELIFWANYLGYKRQSVRSVLEISAYIGTKTHKLIETYLNTGEYTPEIIDRNGPVEQMGIKNSFQSFLKLYTSEKDNFKDITTEKSVSGSRYGGTLDLICKYKKKHTLGDFKTSKDFYPTMFLQLAGYDLLLQETEDIKVDQYMVILLDKKAGTQAKTKICDDKDQMEFYRKCFKKLVEFYYDWYYINKEYWGKDLIQ